MRTHLTLTGQWQPCATIGCTLPFHVSDMTVAEAQALPLEFLVPLATVVQPPQRQQPDGMLSWHDAAGEIHRDYDLPALVADPTNSYYRYSWFQHGELHRDGDQPAVIYAFGAREWYQHGKLHRAGDQPAAINKDGQQTWFEQGTLHRGGGKPAILTRSGYAEWWEDGTQVCTGEWADA